MISLDDMFLLLVLHLILKTKRLAMTRRSKPTLTKTKSLRMIPSLWVTASKRTVISPCSIWAGRGVFESIWSMDRNLMRSKMSDLSRYQVVSPPPWEVAFARGGKSKSASDEPVAKKRSKEGEEDEEGEWGCQG